MGGEAVSDDDGTPFLEQVYRSPTLQKIQRIVKDALDQALNGLDITGQLSMLADFFISAIGDSQADRSALHAAMDELQAAIELEAATARASEQALTAAITAIQADIAAPKA
jgi:hypothetical protein